MKCGAADVVGGVQLDRGTEESVDRAVERRAGGGASRQGGATGVEPGHQLVGLCQWREKNVLFAARLRGRVGAAAAPRGHAEALAARALPCDGEHERGVAAGTSGVDVTLLPIFTTTLLQQLSHHFRFMHGAVVEVVPLARVLPDLRHDRCLC